MKARADSVITYWVMSGAIRPSQRAKLLNNLRNVKMARSAHSYVRGNTVKFYEWLESGSGRALPAGPNVWICGDCHLGNYCATWTLFGDGGKGIGSAGNHNGIQFWRN